MKTTLEKLKKGFILVAFVLLVSACTNSDNNDVPNNDLENNEEQNNEEISETTNNNGDNDSIQEEDIPDSTFFIKEMEFGSVFFKTTLDISSDIEKEVMETLSEFDAVGTEDGAKLTLPEDILFDFDSDQLRSEADEEIEKLFNVAEETESDITIIGHTDSKGEDDYNLELSENRAEAVLQALVDSGIEESRLIAEGKGAEEPIAQNENHDGSDNPEGRQKNRRVEVIIHDLNE